MSKKLSANQFMSRVQYTNDLGQDVFTSTKREMEEALLTKAKSWLHQIPVNEFLLEQLLPMVGETGFGPSSEDIINGSFSPTEEVSTYTT